MTFLRIIVFSVVMMLFFQGFSHMLPQVEPDTSPPVEVSTDGLDMAGMIALGEELFSGKGTCTLCHNGMGRAPDTLEMDLSAIFFSRLGDARYTGVAAGKDGAKAVEGYLRESMQDPSVFVVAGFGKKGSNDTVSPMPVVDAAPIELSPVEMNAVIAFLQDRAAFEPTVPLPSADDVPVAGDAPAVDAALTDPVDIIDEYGCAACHDLNESGADIGPLLGGIGNRMSRALVMEAIIDPNAVIADGFDADFMPDDFGETMQLSELIVLSTYLMELPEAAPVAAGDDEGPASTAIEVIDAYGCGGCHDLEGSEGDLGPNLGGIGARMDRAQIKAAIIDPEAEIADGFEGGMMPDDFGDGMAESELILIVDYLMNLPE
ncbi:MAG: c-type cytochrome [Rhodobacterales bacterium]|nr:c-type cytochrome [Rhodobacterales bacterium]